MEVWKKRRRARKRFWEWRGNEDPLAEVEDRDGDEEGKKRAYPRPRFHPTLCGVGWWFDEFVKRRAVGVRNGGVQFSSHGCWWSVRVDVSCMTEVRT